MWLDCYAARFQSHFGCLNLNLRAIREDDKARLMRMNINHTYGRDALARKILPWSICYPGHISRWSSILHPIKWTISHRVETVKSHSGMCKGTTAEISKRMMSMRLNKVRDPEIWRDKKIFKKKKWRRRRRKCKKRWQEWNMQHATYDSFSTKIDIEKRNFIRA